MQALRPLRKLCLVAAVLAPLAVQGGDVNPSEPLPPSAHHLAVDERTFVSGGIHYRLHHRASERSALQSLLDSGPLRVRVLEVEDSGIRIVSLQRNG